MGAQARRRPNRRGLQRRAHDRRARYTTSLNTLTSDFQAATVHRDPRVVQGVAGDGANAKQLVMDLVRDAGYEAVDALDTDRCSFIETPRRRAAPPA